MLGGFAAESLVSKETSRAAKDHHHHMFSSSLKGWSMRCSQECNEFPQNIHTLNDDDCYCSSVLSWFERFFSSFFWKLRMLGADLARR